MNDEMMLIPDGGMEQGSFAEFDELRKALLAPGSVDDLYNAPGGQLTQQSLEGMLANLTLNENDFTLWKDINKAKAFSTVEEYDQQIGLGISDGGFVNQMENPEFADIDVAKQIAIVKYMSEGWKVADVSENIKTIIPIRARQQQGAMLRLLRNLNRAFYNGNSKWIPESIDGLAVTIAAAGSDQVFDARGNALSMAMFNTAGQLITEGNGHVENANVYASPAGIGALASIIEGDANTTNYRKWITSGQKDIVIGGEIDGIRTLYGKMTPRLDKILGLEFENQGVPVYFNQNTKTWIEGATSDKAPSKPTVTLAVNATATGTPYFSVSGVRPSGTKLRYRVSARNKYGRSVASAVVESASAVAAGGSVTLTITPNQFDSGDKTPTCFVIYGEKVYNSGDFKYLDTIEVDSSNPFNNKTYEDTNKYIPGTARMYILDQTTVGEQRVLAYAQLLPIHNTDLAKLGRFSQGLINLYGTMKYYKPNVLVEIRNIGVTQVNSNRFNAI